MSAPRSPTRANGRPASPTAWTSPTPLRRCVELDSYTTIDLRAGLLQDHWSLELYVKNLGDEDGITAFESPGTLPERRRGPRGDPAAHVGMALGVRF